MIAQLKLHRIDQFQVYYFTMDANTEKELIQASGGTYSWLHEFNGKRYLRSKNVSGTPGDRPTLCYVTFKPWSYNGKTGVFCEVVCQQLNTVTEDIMS